METEKLERVELQQKENVGEGVEVLVCETKQGPLLFESDQETEELNHMNDSKQSEDLMTEASNETVRSCVFKTDNLCMVAGLEEDTQSFKVVKNIELYLLDDESFEAEYDNKTGEETVRYSEQVQRGIVKMDGVKKRLADSLKDSLSLNQHTNVLTEELKERSKQCIERLLEEEEVQRPYIFYFDNSLMISDFVAETGTYLAQVDNQMKEEEKEHLLKYVKEDLEEEEGPSDE